MILTREAIREEIEHKRVRITPFVKGCLQPASIDMSLGDRIRILQEGRRVAVTERVDAKKWSTVVSIKKGFALEPGQLILGITKEKLTLPPDICGWIHARSRFARMGLMVHMSAPFLQPGISNHQVLEIFNGSKNTLVLKPGLRLCSVVLARCEGRATYNGRFKDQKSV